MKNPDVIVIGAGPAGATAAAYLNRKGHRVLVLEKNRFPRFVIGESLLPNCMNYMEEAGLLNAFKKEDFQVKTGATFYKDSKKCVFNFSEQYTKGWSWTWQVQRANFDQKLINEAGRQGVNVYYETEVLDVSTSSTVQTVQFKNSAGEIEKLHCKFIVDASGYGRILPRLFDLNKPSELEARGSIFAHLADNNNRNTKESNNIFIHSFNNNEEWFWIIPFSDNTASFGIVAKNNRIEHYANNEAEQFIAFIKNNPDLNARFPKIDLVLEPKHILGYSIGIKKMHGEGYVLCGNSTEFLDPVFSSGVMLAMGSALAAAKLADKHIKHEKVDWDMEYDAVMNKGIEVFRSYVNAWYDGTLETIFFADKIDQNIKKQICSVLAGYVWDETNPFVKKHKTVLKALAQVVSM